MKKKTIILTIVIIAIVAVTVWFFFFRTDKNERQAYDKMRALINEKIEGGAPFWIFVDMQKNIAGGAAGVDPYYLIKGKLNKTGALLLTMDQEYLPEKYNYNFKGGTALEGGATSRKELHSDMHALWQQYKAAIEQQ